MSAIVISIDPHLGAEKGADFFFSPLFIIYGKDLSQLRGNFGCCRLSLPTRKCFHPFPEFGTAHCSFEITALNSDSFTEKVVSIIFLSP